MRIMHTADWHLGRIFFQVHLTEDQARVLDQLVELAKDSKCDAVVIAGDVYDRAVPPPDAVRLLDDVLCRLVLDLKLPVVGIAGNHDSPERFGFGSRVLSQTGLHLFGAVEGEPTRVTLHDESGPVHFYALPFAEPSAVARILGTPAPEAFTPETQRRRETAGEEASSVSLRPPRTSVPLPSTSCAPMDQAAAMRALVERIRAVHPPEERSVLVAHAFVSGAAKSESERPLSVGGADGVDRDSFEGFNYVALGHLHRPQRAGSDNIAYSGSLLKLSFSEVDQDKSVSIVDMDPRGCCSVERVKLTPRRDVRRVEGLLADILTQPVPEGSRDDYLMVTLLDTDAILDVMGKIREVYPNLLHIERPHLSIGGDLAQKRPDPRKLNDRDLFAAFFSQVTGETLSEAQASAYESVVQELRRREREAD